ncbi:metallophosphoesterase family protein [Amycolatopsis vastitatis]|uniref:Metallophosphoesterase n=1 Tax=Amycolatopsis vastitatis TaxID=1905142 RepID=A0A229SPB9_9PSEU|nr:metallophosphoesterase [Amycolatopsis vastitatis]OXM60660.1 metallophosphoesterase [Amycolatopsis vastitatis]
MRVHVVSDVHGNADALKRAGEGADALVVLGDLIDFVDYRDHDKGIMGALFGAEKVGEFARLRREGTRDETVAYSRTLWASLDDPAGAVDEAIRAQYATLFAAMTAPTYATPGNVDTPALWPEFTGEGVRVLDGEVAEIGGLRFGFVGGALLPDGVVPRRRKGAAWRPYLRDREDYDRGVAALTGVDVLCTHGPPALPELTYDVVARRSEIGSTALLELIRAQRPRWSVFGHVHQPLAARARVGLTECRNVGHFKETGLPYVLRW